MRTSRKHSLNYLQYEWSIYIFHCLYTVFSKMGPISAKTRKAAQDFYGPKVNIGCVCVPAKLPHSLQDWKVFVREGQHISFFVRVILCLFSLARHGFCQTKLTQQHISCQEADRGLGQHSRCLSWFGSVVQTVMFSTK